MQIPYKMSFKKKITQKVVWCRLDPSGNESEYFSARVRGGAARRVHAELVGRDRLSDLAVAEPLAIVARNAAASFTLVGHRVARAARQAERLHIQLATAGRIPGEL